MSGDGSARPASGERPLLGVSVCVVSPAGRVLLVERAKPPFEGLLSLPGGKVRRGERLDEAARRELGEETALSATPTFLSLHEAIGADHHAVIAVHIARIADEAAARHGSDARSLSWFSPEAVRDAEAGGRTTPGLAAIVAEGLRAFRARDPSDGPGEGL